MPYSLEVHFDDITNATIQEMWNVLSQNNIPCRALEKGFSPHITLVYGEISGIKKVNWDFLEKQKTFKFEFSTFAAFPDRGVRPKNQIYCLNFIIFMMHMRNFHR